MRFVLFALVAIGLASSVFAEASVDDTSLLKRQIIRPGTLAIPLPVGKPAPVPAKPAPKPVAKPISRPGTLRIWWRSLSKRQIIRPGTLAIPLPVGKPAPVPAKPAPKPVAKPIPRPGTLRIWWRSLTKRAVTFKTVKVGFGISIKLPVIKKPVVVAPKPVVSAPKPVAPGTLIIDNRLIGAGSPAKPVAPKPAAPPVKITPPGTINVIKVWKRNLSSCTGSTIACPVPGLLHGFDCVDIATNAQQCGDCLALGGVDCSSLPGVDDVSCRNGYCHVESCLTGFAYDFRKRSCVQTNFFTQ